jgi:NAD(P)-dependent dehydrogenase (short-subunit alcohol dehydrogenase family)
MFSLQGKVALVTGAAGARVGTGEGIALALAQAGAHVVLADRNGEAVEATKARIDAAGGTTSVVVFDVTDRADVARGVDEARAAAGPIDILVNSAGGGPLGRFRKQDPDVWEGVVRLNWFGTANVIRAVIEEMCERRYGRIINIASVAGATGSNLGLTAYGGAKAAIMGMTRHLAIEVGRYGVTVNAIAPGGVAGEATFLPADSPHDAYDRMPTGRTGIPSDIGTACVFLAADESAWVTGQSLHVNGGTHTT